VPSVDPADAARLENALAGAISMAVTEVAPQGASRTSQSASGVQPDRGGKRVLAGLNLTLVGEGMNLPEGVAMSTESADEQ
jgi:hypothetical protein